MSNGESYAYTVITRDYHVVRRLAGVKGHKVYIVILYSPQPQALGGLLGQLRKHYNVNYRKGEPIIL